MCLQTLLCVGCLLVCAQVKPEDTGVVPLGQGLSLSLEPDILCLAGDSRTYNGYGEGC